MLKAAISCDVDTLSSIYRGFDLRRPGGYTYAEFRMGLENFSRFLEPFGVKATLFMVGEDFLHSQNIPYIKALVSEGHEIANHTFSHAQGLRFLSPVEKETEIARMEEVCQIVIGRRPLGFRSPGWNISDDVLSILKHRGYLYDSSVFPSLLNPLLKLLHWKSTSLRSGIERTTLGHPRYILAPTQPYRVGNGFGQAGQDSFIEFPITVTPILRLPFFATFLLATGLELFKASYNMIRAFGWEIQYQFHLSDFVDYEHPDIEGQVPRARGVYVPQALRTPLARKMDIFRRALEMIAENYEFITLEQWARKLTNE